MSYAVGFQYVPAGTVYLYKNDYADNAAAIADAAWLLINGFWHQRPDDPTVHVAPQPIFSTVALGPPAVPGQAMGVLGLTYS